MKYLYFIIFGCVCVVVEGQSTICVTPNGEKAQCVPLLTCAVLRNALASGDPSAAKFVEASACPGGKLTVCCGTSGSLIKKPETKPVLNKEQQKKQRRDFVLDKLLPNKTYCGMQHWDDYFHTDEEESSTEASVDEFPWLMVVDSTRRCTGFLISRRFFISTVLCYFYRNSEESKMIIGVHHIRKVISCVPTPYGDDCTDGIIEVDSEKVYDLGRRIVLARLKKDIYFSDFVRPICLPFDVSENPAVDALVMTSGWGEAGSSEEFVKIKKRSKQSIVSNEKCQPKFIPKWETDICTLPLKNSTINTCWGDEGGPIMYKHRNNWFATGIVNSASDCTLGDPTSATRMTPEMLNRILDLMFDDYCDENKDKAVCAIS